MKTLYALLLLFFGSVQCQVSGGLGNSNSSSSFDDPAVLQLLTQAAYAKISNLTALVINSQFSSNAKFCVKDRNFEWNQTFDFSSDLSFLSSCIQKTKGNISRRICTASEIDFYFGGSLGSGFGNANYLKHNINCNLTSWVPGCEPGWACSVSPSDDVAFSNSKDMPARTHDCQSCCEGFFCPHGITCMIRVTLTGYASNNLFAIFQLFYLQLAHWVRIARLQTPTLLLVSVNRTNTNYLLETQTIHVVELIYGQILVAAGKYFAHQDLIVQPISRNCLAVVACFKLTSCDSYTENHNVRAYGILLIAALVVLLLICYNCSDQVLAFRERRLAKTREAAATSVRDKAEARQKWKSAKNAAKKQVHQLSQTFSRRKFAKSPDLLSKSNLTKVEKMDELELSMQPSTSNSSESSHEPKRFEVEDYVKRKIPKEKLVNTNSQVFKYAYAQLENEKAIQQKDQNLTFAEVIARATDPEAKKRPIIEVSFKDLTITLKGKNKHLLRCVTGKILPGRVTAVMGPSGAGKTTFLSALAGKTHGCKTSGLILINGENKSMRSYRKTIGFVPQDDIVHGNLTVEENLWFSAKCRLAADLRRPEKVLIVERVIESLGLQSVRNSLVGTVEKRGISGGQRKRVNVGLELVMEPSLLILDEPTSGLDSTSSQLLLRALRREALEGVNICLVVHQPSYTLFKMFDDLIILAKGGLTVYHGPVKEVEEYFAGLEINVPERVNPPDYFIDVLEGIIKPNINSNINHTELPIRWMLHKGYSVPQDMQQNCAELDIPLAESDIINHTDFSAGENTGKQTFVGEIWQNLRFDMEHRRDIIRHNFLSSRDLSNRRTPGVLLQYRYFLGRIGKQRLREARLLAIDYLILLLAGICLGSLTKVSDNKFGAPGYTNTIIAVSLLCKIAALRSFALDKLQYWRESASGMSSLAYFLAKDSVDHFNTVIKPVVYLSMFYFFSNPRSSFSENYAILMCLVYCVTGIGYFLAIFLEPGSSQLCAVLMPVILTLIATQTSGANKYTKAISNLCYPKWALEAFVISNAERFSGVWLITRCGVLNTLGYDIHNWGQCIGYLILAGVVSRAVAFAGMVAFQKK